MEEGEGWTTEKGDPGMIMCQGVLNWTGQLSCLLINSLRKFSGLWLARRSATIWIDKQSPLCTEQLQHSFVFHYPPLSLFLSFSFSSAPSSTPSAPDKAPEWPKKSNLSFLSTFRCNFFQFCDIRTHSRPVHVSPILSFSHSISSFVTFPQALSLSR